MIQCFECEFYEAGSGGSRIFKCDPFVNIKEPECLLKWQLMRLDMLAASHKGMLGWQKKLGPLQDKLFNYMQREINEIDESEQWRYPVDEQEEKNEDDENIPPI